VRYEVERISNKIEHISVKLPLCMHYLIIHTRW